jgi:hypothetical protein
MDGKAEREAASAAAIGISIKEARQFGISWAMGQYTIWRYLGYDTSQNFDRKITFHFSGFWSSTNLTYAHSLWRCGGMLEHI